MPTTASQIEAEALATFTALQADAKGNLTDTAQFVAQLARELSGLRSDPDFDQIASAYRDQAILRAATNLIKTAQSADDATWNVAIGVLLRALSLV